MLQNKNIGLIIFFLALTACIKSFDPEIDSNEAMKYVVSGRVTDQEGWQEVQVSTSTPIGTTGFSPLSGCSVQILDDRGNSFSLEENEPGVYRVWMGAENLAPGVSFRVNVVTPSGENLASTFDKMTQVPPMDSVHYNIVEIPTNDPEVYHQGIQFYIDLKGEGFDNRYYKWDVLETWEYKSRHPKQHYYDGNFHDIWPPDSTTMFCWKTLLFPEVFTLSTQGLSVNEYPDFPLHFIDGSTSRLGILYSILVTQMSITEEAYNYWEQLRVNSSQSGGLYEKQPVSIIGNFRNLSDTNKVVLGFFYAASISSKRYFYHDIEGLELDFFDYCQEYPLGRRGWREFGPLDYPVYYYFAPIGAIRILTNECVDCQEMGGTLEKPDFWPY